MHINLTRLLIIVVVAFISGCDPATYVSKDYNFKNNWDIAQVVAPSYPFNRNLDENEISISFPKQGEFLLNLSVNSCRGMYEADTDGYISFTRTSCNEDCCQSDWDYYVLTLMKKATSYKGGDDDPLYLFIDKSNYIILEVQQNGIVE